MCSHKSRTIRGDLGIVHRLTQVSWLLFLGNSSTCGCTLLFYGLIGHHGVILLLLLLGWQKLFAWHSSLNKALLLGCDNFFIYYRKREWCQCDESDPIWGEPNLHFFLLITGVIFLPLLLKALVVVTEAYSEATTCPSTFFMFPPLPALYFISIKIIILLSMNNSILNCVF